MNNEKSDCGCAGKKPDAPQRVAEIQARMEEKRFARSNPQMAYYCLRHIRIQGVGRIIG